MKTYSILFILLFLVSVGFVGEYDPTPYQWPKLKGFTKMPIAEDNPVTVEGADLGRHLFYDPILSADSTFSCASCHRQEAAFSDGPKRASIGINGDAIERNTMPLFNLAWYSAMFWDGKAATIEEQVFHPVRRQDEMNLDWGQAEKKIRKSQFYKQKFKEAFGEVLIDSVLIAKAIAQFERTLLSYNSKYDSVLRGEAYLSDWEFKGFVLINDMSMADCLHCHTSDGDAMGTTGKFSNNGLEAFYKIEDYKDKGLGGVTGKPEDIGKFKIPSLRNLLYTSPYMHDGRFNTLEEVLDFYSEGVHASANVDSKLGSAKKGGVHLTGLEKRQIIAFLKTMSDPVFVSSKDFSNPWE